MLNGGFDKVPRNSTLRSATPAAEWALGHPVGNGRTGAMVLGRVCNERISLNHDLLWRRFLSWQDRNAAGLLGDVRKLCAGGKWDEAQDLFLTKVPETSNAIYINPFVPLCDLGLFLQHKNSGEAGGLNGPDVSDYHRELDMDAGVASVEYTIDRRRYRRECFCSFEAGLFVMRLTCSIAGCLCGEVSLSRLLDPECAVTGQSRLCGLLLEGEFEEGVRFAAKARVYQRGGRLTGGIGTYTPPTGALPERDRNGIVFLFRDETQDFAPCGVSTCFDSADEVIIAVALATDDESGLDPAELCERKLMALGGGFPDAQALLAAHSGRHRGYYRRAGLHVEGGRDGREAEELLERVAAGQGVDKSLYGRLYNMGRYLAIASGSPQAAGAAPKSPINLQGLWNQDRRPAWDCDFHLDLNLEMCYWGLDAMNLGELMHPLLDWAVALIPQGRRAARDLFDAEGVLYPATCDNKTVGTPDNIGYCFTSAAAWVAQILWMHYEYSRDESFLRGGLYAFLQEVAAFYDGFLVEDDRGRLTACPSCSPEMGIAGRDRWSVLSSMSTIDMELIREVYSHLCQAAALLHMDGDKVSGWQRTLEKLPLPPIDADHGLREWLEPHIPYDAGHRHRSHCVGIAPGDRITVEDTPEYAMAVRRALNWRHSEGLGSSLSLTTAWDAMICARLYDAGAALKQVNDTIYYNVMENLLMALCDWRKRGDTLVWFGGRRLFQIEAGIGLAVSVAEMLVHDRRGVIRLLPALPDSWQAGEAFGIRARGGFEVSLRWDGGAFSWARIASTQGGSCSVIAFHTMGPVRVSCAGRAVEAVREGNVIRFETEPGSEYLLQPV